MVRSSVDNLPAGRRILALVEELSDVTGVIQKHRGVEVRRIGPEIVLKSRRYRHGIDRHRLWWNGNLVLDGDAGDDHVRVRTYVPGDWVTQVACLVLSWKHGLAAPGQRVGNDRRIGRPVYGRHVPIHRTGRSVRRFAALRLAATIVAHGEGMPTDPSIRFRTLNGFVVAVCIVGPVALMSFHTEDGTLALTVSLDRAWPHKVVEMDGHAALRILGRLSAWTTTDQRDEVIFRAFCERAS